MACFEYEVLGKPGERLTGRLDAESESAASRELIGRGYHVLRVKEAAHEKARYRKHLSLKQVAFLTRQIASLTRAGVPLGKGLSALEKQTKDEHVRAVLKSIRESIKEGSTFSEALESQSSSFSGLYVNMVRAGEAGGVLEEVLTRLASLLQKEVDLKSRVRSALAYPSLVVLVGCITVFVLLTFVIPKLAVLFVEAGRSLPLPTLILMSISSFFHSFWWAILTFLVIAVLVLRSAHKSQKGKSFADGLVLKMPLLGTLVQKVEMARLARVLGTLLRNGVTMLKALEVTGATLTNTVIGKTLTEISAGVRQGDSLSIQMERITIFPPLMTQAISVGEESGSLDQSLLDVAEEYDGEVDRAVRTMVSMIEPILIILVGGGVGFIVLALLLPIFDLNEVIQ